MQYATGASALALVGFCLLCIIFLTAPVHASVGNGHSAAQTPLDVTPTDTNTPSPTVTTTPSPTVTTTPSPTVTNTPSPTVTTTPSPTVTNTPSPTVTSTVYPYPTPPTTTPAPSPTVTHNVFPSPTTTVTVGAKASPTVVASPGVTATSTLGAGTNQGPTSSPTPANNSGDSSNTEANPLANALPLILAGLGVIALLALLYIPVRNLLRKRLVPLPSPKLPPSGAAPWSRAPVSALTQPGKPFPYAQPGHGPFYTPTNTGAPFPGSFNAAPTLANVPGNPWVMNATPVGQYSPSTPPVVPAFPGYGTQAQPQTPRPFPVPPAIPTTHGYGGLAQDQQPFPTTPPFLPGAQVEFTERQPGPPGSPTPAASPAGDTTQPGNLFNNAARTRLRRNALRTSGEHMAFGEQISGDISADMMVVSDPYLRAMLKQHSQKGQIVQQAPEESS